MDWFEERFEREENNKNVLINLIEHKIKEDKLDDLSYNELRQIADILKID